MRKDAATIRSMFSAIAPRYDFLNHTLSCNIDRIWRKRAVKLAAARGPVLDVCTGTGDLAAAFHRAGAGPVVGADFCGPMLREGRTKEACRAIRFVRGDALHLPFPTDTFDVVSVAFGIRNVSDLDQGLGELARVARPGGRILVLEFSRPKNSLFAGAYRFYLRRVLPYLGNLVSRSRAYSYLQRSVDAWVGAEELSRRLEAAGCGGGVQIHPLTGGVAAIHLGVKG